ncbi:MAG TPA: ABC transporter ATP-binding protein [Pseudolabrys sp.]|nr:ABC transporter ATP-binding protein [Pseudolabrys sp.]
MAPDSAILDVQGVTAGYGGSAVLQDLGLSVRSGTMTGVIGPNGAGKSTLLKVIVGYLRPSQGEILLDGVAVTGLPPEQRIAKGIAYIAQTRSHFPSQTVQENLRLGAYLVKDARLRAERQNAVFERFPILHERRRQLAGQLSGGEARMLEVGRMMMTAPRLAILDEPSVGLSPKLVDVVYGHVRSLCDQGMSFLIVEQNVRKLLSVADFIYALEGGRNRYDGTPHDLSEDGRLAELYLGARG